MKRAAPLLGALLLGCGSAEPPQAPVVVYAAVEDGERLAAMLEGFTSATEIPVDIRSGTAVEHVDAMIAKTGDPADAVITDDLVEIWRAADRGALRPIRSAALGGHHESLRDPDFLWFVHEIRPIAIVGKANASPGEVSFEDLGNPPFKDRLCLSSSALVNNRVLLANLIERNGRRQAERLVRRWVRNLAEPPFSDEATLRAAIQTGACDYGIASNSLTGFGEWDEVPAPRAYAATVVGIGRHAVNPDEAQALADWMLRNASVRIRPDSALPNAAIAGWRDEEVRMLAERAGYR